MGFAALETTPYNVSWSVSMENSPDEDLDNGTLSKLRLRARQLIKDETVAAGAQQAYINLVSFPTVIQVRAKNDLKARKGQEVIDNFSANAAISGQETLQELVEQVVAWSFCDGDLLVNLSIDSKRPGVQTVVDLIEAHRVTNPHGSRVDPLFQHGVEYDSDGRVVAYHVRKPATASKYQVAPQDVDRFPVSRGGRVVSKLFKAPLNSRPKSSRQYPVLTPVIPLLKNLADYKEALIIGARVAACFSAFITTSNPAGTFAAMPTVDDPRGSSQKVMKLQPGTISHLKQNEEITFADPNKPGDNVDAFFLRSYKLISMYLRIPYNILFLDTRETNYSSWRGSVIETRKSVVRWRNAVSKLLVWVCNAVLEEALLLGQLSGTLDDYEINLRWPSLGILDPEKEARANKLRLGTGEASVRMIIEESGEDYDRVMLEREEFAMRELEMQARLLSKKKELEAKYGIVFPNEDGSTPSNGEDIPGGDPEEDNDEEKQKRRLDGNW